MTERNTSSERLSERDVDRLLQQFFVDEVPQEFRREQSPVTLAKLPAEPIVRTTASDSSRSLAGMLGILVSATCCLIVTFFIPGTPDDEDTPTAHPTVGEFNRNHKPVTEEKSAPVEERPQLRFTTTGDHDVEPGSETKTDDPLEPELNIEIYPLRPDKPRK